MIRDFRWKLEGTIEDRGNDTYFSGQVRAMPVFRRDGDFSGETTIELRIEPMGKLVDGSSGKTIRRTVIIGNTPFAENVPLGNYRVTASMIDGNRRSALEIRKNESSLSSVVSLEFQSSSDSCGGDFGNGTSRAFVYIGQP